VNRGPRDRGRGGPLPDGPSPRAKVFGNTDDASAEHRRKLEALFGGQKPAAAAAAATGPSESPRPRPAEGKVFASPRKSVGRSPSEYRMRLERLRIAREVEEIREAADGFLQHHQLPDDVDILYKVLQHPSEKVVREALGQISSLISQGRINGGMILEDRLNGLSDRGLEAATRSYVEGVRSQLARLKRA
jgi:hypothetical protein